MSESSLKSVFWAGVVNISPILIGVIPFALIAGVAAVDAGLDSFAAYALSPLVFAGASQLAAADLIGRDASLAVIVLTVLVINSRMVMYSASMAPHFVKASIGRKAAIAYLLTDQAFAVSILRLEERNEELGVRVAYYLGAGLGLWTTWQAASLAGVLIGAGVPSEWSLDFAVPLVFMALTFLAIKDRTTLVAAVVGATVAVAAFDLSYNLGLPLAALTGIGAGLAFEMRWAK